MRHHTGAGGNPRSLVVPPAPAGAGVLRQSVDAQALLHRITLIPDVQVIGSESVRPGRRQRVDALDDDAIDVVVEYRPRVFACDILVQPFTRLRGAKRRCRRSFKVLQERDLSIYIRVRPGARDVTAQERVEGDSADLFDLREVAGDVVRHGEASPRHPTRKHHRPP